MTKRGGAVDFEPGRYARHRLVDWFDQDEVGAVRALVVGAGAIGNEVLKNLALLGVRHLTIVDLDHIEVHNLTRSVLFRESDVGRSKAEVDEILRWLTGYSQKELAAQLKKQVDFETFFAESPQLNPSRDLIKGTICGVRIEEIQEPLMREIRYLDKLVDELAKGRPMAKILRQP